jgi:hypothetical protein
VAPARRTAARPRGPGACPARPLPADVALSDLLLVRPGDYGAAPDLATVIDSAAGAPVVRAGDAFGVYWEQYAPAAPGAPRTVAITATRTGVSALERLGALVGRAVVAQPVSLRYADPVPPTAGPGRYVSLRWPVVPPGTYRLSVRVGTDAVGLRSDPPGSGATPADTAAAGTTAVDTSAADTAALPPAAGPAAPGAVATLIVRVVR